jgi:hypothetical protein
MFPNKVTICLNVRKMHPNKVTKVLMFTRCSCKVAKSLNVCKMHKEEESKCS